MRPAAIDVQLASRLRGIPPARSFRRWLGAALTQPAELTLRVVNAAEARVLNREFRGRDYPTNVLTFVYHAPGAAALAGDIVLCAPVVAREAREQGKRLADHYAHLAVHGALHLAGMDHERPRDARRMEALERQILAGFGIEDPYR
ncbi:MAG TPA: rRNA maturation RNase YbeY [Usitatibacteraceae bacterium]|nr:rRNA maturation RNase YbeY [Usitatibacteraceae bacterium]